MNVVIVFAVLAVIFFVASFITKRRFGLLGLALAAGAMLSTLWGHDAGLVVGALGIAPDGPLTTAVTLSIITLLPAIILLFHGYSYKGMIGRVVGALLFTLLALAFLVEPLGYALSVEGFGADAYRSLVEYKGAIISFGLVLAVLDLFFTRPAASVEKKFKK